MDQFTAVLNTFTGPVTLRPRSLSLSCSLGSPAQGLRAVFPLESWPAETVSLQLLRGSEAFLTARPDRQTARYSAEGMLLEVSARTKGAALLDNEAKPKAYENLTAQTLFNELIAPFGFVLLHQAAAPLPEFTIRKGWTLWDAFRAYTRRVYGLVPYVEDNIVRATPPQPGDPVLVGGTDHPIASLERIVDYYAPLSRIYLRGEEGEYAASVGNQEAALRDIARVRYLIPAGEFAAAPAWDATQRIERSMRELLAVRVTLPGFLWLPPGRGVWVRHPKLSESNLLVDEIGFTLDGSGARTTLTLRSSLYY